MRISWMWMVVGMGAVSLMTLSPAGCAQPAAGGNSTEKAASAPATTASDSPVAPGAKPQKLADGFSFTEGCTSDEQGNVFFVDQPNDSILEWTAEGKLITWMKPSGHSNGMCFDAKGDLISCADEKNELWSITPEKKVTVLVKEFAGKPLNGPNDVWIRPDGGMYMTDPLYPREWWSKERGQGQLQETRGVLYLAPDRKTLTRVISDFKQPNGIIGTPDGKTLYVSDIDASKTWSYTINADGTLADKKLFCSVGSDGMTIDSEGNVYTTTRGKVLIFDKTGQQIDSLPINGANVCFGGKDGHTLFITARAELWAVQMRTKRVGPQ
jgi:gluconolactonase